MFDAEKFEAAYAHALPHHEEVHVASMAAMGLMSPTSALSGGFCDNWPKIEGTLNAILAIPFIGWFVPGFATFAPMIKAFLTAADQTLLPAICPAHVAAPAPVKTNVSQTAR